ITVRMNLERERCTSCNEFALPLILVPGAGLTQYENAYVQAAFGLARDALIESTDWVVLGYSCPTYDSHIIELLREASGHPTPSGKPRRVILVSPDPEEPMHRLETLLHQKIWAYKATFSDFVSAGRSETI